MPIPKKPTGFSFRDWIPIPTALRFEENGEQKYSSIQICRVGEWEHPVYGDFEFTSADLKQMQRNFSGNNREIVMDYQHGSAGWSTDPEDGKAAGWFDGEYGLKIKAGGTE